MIRKWNVGMAGALVAMLLCGSGVARAQYGGAKPAQTPAPSQTGTTTPAPKPLTLDNAAPAPVNSPKLIKCRRATKLELWVKIPKMTFR